MTTQKDICWLFMRIHLLHRLAIQQRGLPAELRPGQLPMLECIAANGGCTQKELADMLSITPASAALSTKRLQKAGLIDKRPSADSLRSNTLTVTEKGLRCAEECRAQFDLVGDRMLSGFSQEELGLLGKLLRRVTENLSPETPPPQDASAMFALKNRMDKDEIRKLRSETRGDAT